jgi:hypothetical protein
VPEVSLQRPRVVPLVRQRVAASVPKPLHFLEVRVDPYFVSQFDSS